MITKPCKCGKLPRITVLQNCRPGFQVATVACQCRDSFDRLAFGNDMLSAIKTAIERWNERWPVWT